MFSKRKERSGWSFERRKSQTGSKASKEVTYLSSNASKGEDHGARKSVGPGGRHATRRNSSSNSETSDKSRIRTRRRKRRRMRARENQEANGGFKKKGHRKSKPKRKVTARGIAGCSESSWSGSHPLPTSNTSGLSNLSQPTDCWSHDFPDEYFKLPYGNLNLPMDLSHIEFEVNDKHAVDFELLAQKNHERWLANLKKERGGCE